MSDDEIAGSNMASPGSKDFIPGALNLFNSLSQLYTGWRNREFQRETNEIMRRDAWDRWRANNEYNLPVNQVQRLIDAGFNPHLLNGSPVDAGSSGSPSESPALAASNQAAPYIDPLAMAQAENLRAQTEAIEHQTEREDEKQLITLESMRQSIEESKSQVDVNKATVTHMSVQDKDIYSQIATRAAELEISRETAESQMQLWNAQAGLADAQAIKTAEEYRQLVLLYSLVKEGMELDNALKSANISLTNAERVKVSSQIKNLDALTDRYYGQTYLEAWRAGVDVEFERQRIEQHQTEIKFMQNFYEQQTNLMEAQEEYWRDYRMQPWRYHSTPQDIIHLPDPDSRSRRSSRGGRPLRLPRVR